MQIVPRECLRRYWGTAYVEGDGYSFFSIRTSILRILSATALLAVAVVGELGGPASAGMRMGGGGGGFFGGGGFAWRRLWRRRVLRMVVALAALFLVSR